MSNPYAVTAATVERVRQESPLIRTLRLRPETPLHFQTGQFIELSVPGIGEGPFTPSSSHFRSEVFDVTVMKAGFVTGHIHAIRAGARLGIRGPYGSGYPLTALRGKDVLILGGGCGLAPLRSLMLTLLDEADQYRSITFLAGAKTPHDCIFAEELDSWRRFDHVTVLRAVDEVPAGEAWDEAVCLVTRLLDRIELHPDGNPAIVCGPPVMMKFGTRDLLAAGYREENIYLSMEKKMYCGFGQCRHCAMGSFYACRDGPVFSYARIKNEEALWA